MLPVLRDVKQRVGAAVQSAIWSAVCGIAAIVMVAFLLAALFIWLDRNLGDVAACLVFAGLFLLCALVAGGVAAGIRRREARLAEIRAQNAAATWRDPAMISAALQVGRTLGLKRAAPLMALGAAALGLLLSRLWSRQKEDADRGAET